MTLINVGNIQRVLNFFRSKLNLQSIISVSVIVFLPIIVRFPGWFMGLSEDPFWSSAHLTLPGAISLMPGLPGFLDFNAGWTTQALGSLSAHQWLAGHIPWWNPYSGVGLPLAAEMQSSALFLPYILLLALPHGMVLLTIALQWTAGLATWRLLRRFDLKQGAVVGALLFELSASFSWMGAPAGLPVAFLPLFLLGIERARAKALEHRPGGYRLIAVAVALSLYAGFFETAYLDGLLALIWAIARGLSLPSRKVNFALRVMAGGAIGILLSAPILFTFFDYLLISDLGGRETINMALLAHPPQGLVQLLAPYALGLPAGLSGNDESGTLLYLWGRAGGYVGTILALGAILGGVAAGNHRKFRLLLLIWICIALSKVTGLPGALTLFPIPFGDQIQFFRYSGAAWLMPCCVLAAFGVEYKSPKRTTFLVSSLLFAMGCAAAWAAWPLLQHVSGVEKYYWYSLAWGVVSLIFGACAYASGRLRMTASFLVADAALLFIVPFGAGYRHANIDMPGIEFLKSNLGLNRFATLGPFQPNYGAMFDLASVNSNYLPSPNIWSNYITASLRPGATASSFIGNFPPDEPGKPSNADIFSKHLPAYAKLGVRYLLSPSEQDPYSNETPVGPPEPWHMLAGSELSGSAATKSGTISAISVKIGTFSGASHGPVEFEICADRQCVRGQAILDTALDNAPLLFVMDHPIVSTGRIDWTIRHPSGSPVAIWRWAGPKGREPLLTPVFQPPQPVASKIPGLEKVYSDSIMNIYEINGFSNYFEAANCVLTPHGRTNVDASCKTESTLVRRELMLPGWHVRVDNTDEVPHFSDPLFQAVTLPAGVSHVTYSYTPNGIEKFTVLFGLGILGLLPLEIIVRCIYTKRMSSDRSGRTRSTT